MTVGTAASARVAASSAAASAARASVGAAVIAASEIARTGLATATTTITAFTSTLTPRDVVSSTLSIAITLAMRRARALRLARDDLIVRLELAEAELNATKPELNAIKIRLASAERSAHHSRSDAASTRLQKHALKLQVEGLEARVHASRFAVANKRNESAASLSQLREMHATDLEEAQRRHADELAQVQAKRANLNSMLQSRRRAHNDARRELASVSTLKIEADEAKSAAADAVESLAAAEARMEASSREAVNLSERAEAEKERADAAEAKMRELEERPGTVGMATQASLASLQLELHSAREQSQSLRAGQKKQAMAAARAASDAAAELGNMQQRLTAAEAAHASETARAEALWAQREAEFRADLQASHSRRQSEAAALALEKAEIEATLAEAEARLQSMTSSERSTEAALKQARSDAKNARVAASQHAARAASLEETLAHTRVESEKHKHEAVAFNAEHDERLLEADLALRRAKEALEQERSSRRETAVQATQETEALRRVAREANAALTHAREEANEAKKDAAAVQEAIQVALANANAKGAALAHELEKARATAAKADEARRTAAAETEALKQAREREERAAARRERSMAAARLDRPVARPTSIDPATTEAVRAAAAPADAVPQVDAARAARSAAEAATRAAAEAVEAAARRAAAEAATRAAAEAATAAVIGDVSGLTTGIKPRGIVQPKAPVAKQRRPLAMIVSKMAQHVSPAKLLVEFPTALEAIAHYDIKTGERTALVLTFAPGSPPARRTSSRLGCVLQSVVTMPEGAKSSRRVVWFRKNGAVRQRTDEMAAANTRAAAVQSSNGEMRA